MICEAPSGTLAVVLPVGYDNEIDNLIEDDGGQYVRDFVFAWTYFNENLHPCYGVCSAEFYDDYWKALSSQRVKIDGTQLYRVNN